MWIPIIILDTIFKAFQYAWFIIIPLAIALIFIIIKRKKLKHAFIYIRLLSLLLIALLLTSRLYGPALYMPVINLSIGNKESLIEQKLEKKYNRNFTFVDKSDIELEDLDAGNSLGGDVVNDYYVTYKFKDDDDVVAIVIYKKTTAYDYYETKRSKYEIENALYQYAKEINFDYDFYAFVSTSSHSVRYSDLDSVPMKDYISEERQYDRIYIYTPVTIQNFKSLMSKALKDLYKDDYLPYVHEYTLTQDAYDKVVKYFEDETVKNGIEGDDYDGYYRFFESDQLNKSNYRLE